jgi:preprotein translocase subunit SecF
MLNRQKIEQLERENQRRIIANGKSRFIRREVAFSVLFFAMLMSFLYFFSGRTRSGLVACLVVLAVGILSGYLHAIWKWQDITKQIGNS